MTIMSDEKIGNEYYKDTLKRYKKKSAHDILTALACECAEKAWNDEATRRDLMKVYYILQLVEAKMMSGEAYGDSPEYYHSQDAQEEENSSSEPPKT